MIFLDSKSLFLSADSYTEFLVRVHSYVTVCPVVILIQQLHECQQHIHELVLYTGMLVAVYMFKQTLCKLISGICRPCKPIDCKLLILRDFLTEQVQLPESIRPISDLGICAWIQGRPRLCSVSDSEHIRGLHPRTEPAYAYR